MTRTRASRRLATAVGFAVVPVLAACSSGGDGGAATTGQDATTMIVFAAASLRSTFEELGEEFESEHDGVDVQFNFDGSSNLVAQIQQGASAGVFASADTANMDKLVADGLVTEPRDFATNTLMIAVPADNPAGVTSLADLTREELNVVICAPEVPCGRATGRVEALSGLDIVPDSEEQNVTDVLNKVVAGEADAGMVYVTDVINAGETVMGIEFPESSAAVNTYPIATVVGAGDEQLAEEFVQLVLGPSGRSVLESAGFGAPGRTADGTG